MGNLSNQEIDILYRTNRAIRWRRYSRWAELASGLGILGFAFWAANDRDVSEWFTSGGGIYGLLGALGGSIMITALRNWGHNRNQLLVKLAEGNESLLAALKDLRVVEPDCGP